MEFLQNNWLWLIVIGLLVWLQASGRGCCGHKSHRAEHNKDIHADRGLDH